MVSSQALLTERGETKGFAIIDVGAHAKSAPYTSTARERIGIGLRGRLQLAFGAITLLVVIATGIGLYAFFEVGNSLDQITERALPPALAAGELLAKAENIVAAGPALLASNSGEEINKLTSSVNEKLANAKLILDQLRQADLDLVVLDQISNVISNLDTNLALLQKTTHTKVSTEVKRKTLLEGVFSAHRDFDLIWEPRFSDLRSRVLRLQRSLASSSELRDDRGAALHDLDQAILALLPLEQIRRDFSATFEFIVRGSAASNTTEVAELKNQAQRTIKSIDGLVSDIDPDLSTELFRPIARLRADVRGDTNIFNLRQMEIDATARSKQLIVENTVLSAQLRNFVEQFVASSRNAITIAALAAKQSQKFNATMLYVVTLLALISSFLIVWLYVGRSIVGRLTHLSGIMLSIAAGRREIAVPVVGTDEVGAMGRAVEVFRKNAIELDQLLVERADAAIKLEKIVEQRTAELRASKEKAENALAELNAAQQNLIDAERLAALGGLVAGVAHEVNTPIGISLTVASGFARCSETFAVELNSNVPLRRSQLDEFVSLSRDAAQQLVSNLQRAAELIQSFKQVAVDRSNAEHREFNLHEATNQIVASLGSVLKKMHVTVVTTMPDDLILDSYPGLYGQILTNLLLNSVNHAFSGGRAGTISISAVLHSNDAIELVFIDDGVGMTSEVQRQAFDPFFTTRRNEGGTGLGLHIVRNLIVQQLGGRIQLESKPGQGTVFRIIMSRNILRSSDMISTATENGLSPVYNQDEASGVGKFAGPV